MIVKKVDDILAKYTTIAETSEQPRNETDTAMGLLKLQMEAEAKSKKFVASSDDQDDSTTEEFLQSTKLDDYVSGDERDDVQSEDSSSSVSVERTRRSRMMTGLKKLWPVSTPRVVFRRSGGSTSSSFNSDSSRSLIDD